MPNSDESDRDRTPLSVEAVIVTHDDPDALRDCVRAVQQQTTPVASIHIVDTAGRQGVPREVSGQSGVRVERLSENLGPAGGWAAGIGAFLAGETDAAWLLDDDCVPASTCLEVLLSESGPAQVVQSKMLERGSGRETPTQGWCSVLLAREVVEKVGVPDETLVWWTEDTEYLQWRIPRAGFTVMRSETAEVEVSLRPRNAPKPAWKYFYEARNQVAYRLHTQRTTDVPMPRHLTGRVRRWRAVRSVVLLAARATLVERTDRAEKLGAVLAGAVSGVFGRSGLERAIGESDRARCATAVRAA